MRSASNGMNSGRATEFLMRLAVIAAALLTAPGAARADAPAANAQSAAIEAALPAVVKLYGAGISLEHGYGVGVLISADGLAVTALSLLLEGTGVRAVLHDGRETEATVLRRDDARQLALIRVAGDHLPHLELGTSDRLLPGDPILAMGNTYKVAEGEEAVSVVRGVFSLRTQLAARRRKQVYHYRGDVLLFDAITCNPGMAGGPLLDLDGRFVGMLGKIVVSDRTNTYLSFALPVEEVRAFLAEGTNGAGGSATATQVATTGDAPRGETAARGGRVYTGIRLFELGRRKPAAYVDRVAPDSPAARAGLKSDDLILAVDGVQARSTQELKRMMERWTPGRSVSLTIKRGDQILTADLVPDAAP